MLAGLEQCAVSEYVVGKRKTRENMGPFWKETGCGEG